MRIEHHHGLHFDKTLGWDHSEVRGLILIHYIASPGKKTEGRMKRLTGVGGTGFLLMLKAAKRRGDAFSYFTQTV